MSIQVASDPSPTASAAERDFDVHGFVGIRLVDATEKDVATVQRQLGDLRATLDRVPDITIRFVDRITTAPLIYVGMGESGHNADGFFVLRGKGGIAARALIPFQHIGSRLTIVCERAMPAVPHLISIINLTAMAKGVLPLHASAFTDGSRGVLVAGWAKGGKTESLLACMSRGAQYVGDEWVYLTENGDMFGVPEPIRLWDWQLQQLPEIMNARPLGERLGLSAWRSMAALASSASRTRLPGSKVLRRGSPIIRRQAHLHIPPVELFGTKKVVLKGRLDAVVLVISREAPDILIASTDRGEVSGRMAASLADERAAFMTSYRQFRYAFPASSNAIIDNAETTESRLLAALLDGRPSAKVLHPYPCDILALGEAVHSAAFDAMTSATPDGAQHASFPRVDGGPM